MNYKYNENYDTFCFQNCINYILQLNHVENSEFYINKSMSMNIKKNSKCNLDYHFSYACYDVVPQFMNNIRTKRSTEDAYDVLMNIIAKKDNSTEIILGVDSYYLPYLPYYQKSHGLHSVIFKYIDPKQGIFVVDKMKPWMFEGYVNLNEFLQARRSENNDDGGMFSNIPVENRWKEVSLVDWNGKLEELVQQQICLSIEQYYVAEEDGEEAKGIGALIYIIDYLKKFNELSDVEKEQLLAGMHKVLYRLNHRRRFWFDFVEKIPERLVTTTLKQYKNEIVEIDKISEELLYRVLMLKFKKSDKFLGDLIERLNNLIEHEKRNGGKLIQYEREQA